MNTSTVARPRSLNTLPIVVMVGGIFMAVLLGAKEAFSSHDAPLIIQVVLFYLVALFALEGSILWTCYHFRTGSRIYLLGWGAVAVMTMSLACVPFMQAITEFALDHPQLFYR